MSNKRLRPNIVRGGVAIPIPNKKNYYYMKGRKHEQGGIDIGKNPRTGLEVEDGEVMHISPTEVKVFSSVPFLNGESPAEKVIKGNNPNKVFNEQESFKRRNKINDDGTKKKAEYGILDKIDEYAEKSEPYIAGASLGLTGATLAAPNPYTAAGAYLIKLAGGGIDAYQAIRHFVKGNYKQGFRNAGEAALSLIGGKAIRYFAKTKAGKQIGAAREKMIDEAYRKRSNNKVILMRKGLTDEQAASIVLTNAANAVDNSAKFRDIKEGIEKNNKKTANTVSIIGDAVVDTNDVKEGINNKKMGGINNKYPELRKRAKNGGVYTVTSNGKTSLRMIPSTGERIKFKNGGTEDIEKTVTLNPEIYSLGLEDDLINKINKTKNDSSINITKYFKYNPNTQTEIKYNLTDKYNRFNKLNGVDLTAKLDYNRYINNKEKYNKLPKSERLKYTKLGIDSTKVEYSPDGRLYSLATGAVPISIPKIGVAVNPINLNEIKPVDINKNKVYYNYNDILKKDRYNSLISDGIGITSNIVGSIIGYNANKKALEKMKYTKDPVNLIPSKLKTSININPQLDAVRDQQEAYERQIDANTASSRVALGRKQLGRLNTIKLLNNIYSNKENTETELINKDRLNQQAVANQNITNYNTWKEKKNTFENAIIEKQSENTIGLINSINAGVQNAIGNFEKRLAAENNIRAIAAANPNVNPIILKALGVRGITNDMIESWLRAYGNKNS